MMCRDCNGTDWGAPLVCRCPPCHEKAIKNAVEAERELCAKLAAAAKCVGTNSSHGCDECQLLDRVALAIRERGIGPCPKRVRCQATNKSESCDLKEGHAGECY
jgi:hypothetical protein